MKEKDLKEYKNLERAPKEESMKYLIKTGVVKEKIKVLKKVKGEFNYRSHIERISDEEPPQLVLIYNIHKLEKKRQ